VSDKRVWKRLLGVEQIVIEGRDLEDSDRGLVVSARPAKRACGRCSRREKRFPFYDPGGRPAAMAGDGPRDDEGVHRGSRATGSVSGTRDCPRLGSLGAARLVVHTGLRGLDRVAGRACEPIRRRSQKRLE